MLSLKLKFSNLKILLSHVEKYGNPLVAEEESIYLWYIQKYGNPLVAEEESIYLWYIQKYWIYFNNMLFVWLSQYLTYFFSFSGSIRLWWWFESFIELNRRNRWFNKENDGYSRRWTEESQTEERVWFFRVVTTFRTFFGSLGYKDVFSSVLYEIFDCILKP